VKHVKTGALIAAVAGTLFVAACEKKEDKPAGEPAKKEEPAKTEPAKTEPAKDEAAKPDPAATADQPPAEKTAMVDCGGVNACKGQGTCKQEGHGCGGQNACKGQGVLTMSEEECTQKGGKVVAKK
jgi:hypothetical protein